MKEHLKQVARAFGIIALAILFYIVLFSGFLYYIAEIKETELLREVSPDGKFSVLIQEIGKPDFPFGSDHIGVTLFEKRSKEHSFKPYYRVAFDADIPTDGTKAGYRLEWLDDGVQVILKGERGREYYYILPFKTLE